MITKQADLLVGSLTGAIRAGRLSAEDKALLTKKYKMDPDSSLKARNAGRGILGGMAGSLAGSLVGTGAAIAAKKDPRRIARLMALGGSTAGIAAGTDKYSRGAAKRIRDNA